MISTDGQCCRDIPMESLYDDDIDIIGNGDIVDGNSTHKNPDSVVPKFYIGTSSFPQDSDSHLALQKAYADLKNRYNGLALKFRDRERIQRQREVDFSNMSRETNVDDCYQMPSMAQAAGAEMPEVSSEVRAQMGYSAYLQRQLMQEQGKTNRFQIENESLKDKVVDLEKKYKNSLIKSEQLQRDLDILTEKNQIGKSQESELIQSKDKKIVELSEKYESLKRTCEQLQMQLVDSQKNLHELERTRRLLIEREQEIADLRRQVLNSEHFGSTSREQLGKNSSLGNSSTLEDLSLQKINSNEEIIRKLQTETMQQTSIIRKLLEQVEAKQNSMAPQSRYDVPVSQNTYDSRHRGPLTGSDIYMSQQGEATQYSISDNPRLTVQGSSVQKGNSCLKFEDGLVSFSVGSPDSIGSPNRAPQPTGVGIRRPSEHSENVSDAHMMQNYRHQSPINSQILPLSTHQSVQNSTSVGTSHNIHLPRIMMPTMFSSTGLTNDSIFKDPDDLRLVDSGATERLTNSDRSKLQKLCPICSMDCSEMSIETFQAHVFDCFDNDPDPPETLQPHVDIDRKCPMCNVIYPESVSQDDFEKHVQSHFGEDAITERFEVLRP